MAEQQQSQSMAAGYSGVQAHMQPQLIAHQSPQSIQQNRTFPFFTKLAPELRKMVWEFVCSEPRLITITHRIETTSSRYSQVTYWDYPTTTEIDENRPTAFDVCHESRDVAIEMYGFAAPMHGFGYAIDPTVTQMRKMARLLGVPPGSDQQLEIVRRMNILVWENSDHQRKCVEAFLSSGGVYTRWRRPRFPLWLNRDVDIVVLKISPSTILRRTPPQRGRIYDNTSLYKARIPKHIVVSCVDLNFGNLHCLHKMSKNALHLWFLSTLGLTRTSAREGFALPPPKIETLTMLLHQSREVIMFTFNQNKQTTRWTFHPPQHHTGNNPHNENNQYRWIIKLLQPLLESRFVSPLIWQVNLPHQSPCACSTCARLPRHSDCTCPSCELLGPETSKPCRCRCADSGCSLWQSQLEWKPSHQEWNLEKAALVLRMYSDSLTNGQALAPEFMVWYDMSLRFNDGLLEALGRTSPSDAWQQAMQSLCGSMEDTSGEGFIGPDESGQS